MGRRVLEHEIRRQIYEDGSYLQHSMNYHRLMLHDCIWAIRLAELNGQPLSSKLIDRVRRAAEFLFQMTDPDTGRVPNYAERREIERIVRANREAGQGFRDLVLDLVDSKTFRSR